MRSLLQNPCSIEDALGYIRAIPNAHPNTYEQREDREANLLERVRLALDVAWEGHILAGSDEERKVARIVIARKLIEELKTYTYSKGSFETGREATRWVVAFYGAAKTHIEPLRENEKKEVSDFLVSAWCSRVLWPDPGIRLGGIEDIARGLVFCEKYDTIQHHKIFSAVPVLWERFLELLEKENKTRFHSAEIAWRGWHLMESQPWSALEKNNPDWYAPLNNSNDLKEDIQLIKNWCVRFLWRPSDEICRIATILVLFGNMAEYCLQCLDELEKS